MRIPRTAVVMTTALLICAVGCTNQITGTATQDPTQPPLALSEDGFGIVAGYPDAPVQIEIYTEPQCTHCAELQPAFGGDIERYINLGQLAVTYRPLTFLDTPSTDYHPSGSPTRCSSLSEPPRRRTKPTRPRVSSSSDSSKTCGPTRIPADQGPTDERDGRDGRGNPACPTMSRAGSRDGETADNVDIEEMAAYNYGCADRHRPDNHRHPNGLRPGTRARRSTSTTTTG